MIGSYVETGTDLNNTMHANARGSSSPHSLALSTSDLHLCMGPTQEAVEYEYRKLSVPEFYLPSRLFPHSPKFTLLTLGTTIQNVGKDQNVTYMKHRHTTFNIQLITSHRRHLTLETLTPTTSIHLQLPPLKQMYARYTTHRTFKSFTSL